MVMKGNQIKDDTGWSYGKHWKEEKCMQGCDRQSEETDCLEDLGTDGQV
jgi:hypothetical protein